MPTSPPDDEFDPEAEEYLGEPVEDDEPEPDEPEPDPAPGLLLRDRYPFDSLGRFIR